jgi:hypothetical protein
MRSSQRLLLLLAVTTGLSACAHVARVPAAIHHTWIAAKSAVTPRSKHRNKPTPPTRYAARTATLSVTFGLKVAGVVSLPRYFVPDMTRAPLWLQGGNEVGVIGTNAGKGAMLGYSGAELSQRRVVLEDYGAGAAGGRLLDATIAADGQTLATAIVTASGDRLEVNLVDLSRSGAVKLVGSLEGEFDSAQLTFLRSGNIALVAHAATNPADDTAPKTAAVSVSGLYLITPGSSPSVQRLESIKCALSHLVFSPNDAFAMGEGGDNTPPALIDIHARKCREFAAGAPLQVLGWAPNSAAFLYRSAERSGVFRFDLLSGRIATIAISSGAAAYASDGTIIAFGSQELSWRRAVAQPMTPVKAQIALLDPHQSLTTINSLGFATEPALIAQSTMVFSQVSNDAIIDTAIPGLSGPVREIVEYSYPARAAFVLAHGAVRGPVAISWSPNGKQIAIVDGDATRRTLAVITPPK